jgi:hypothetical protein
MDQRFNFRDFWAISTYVNRGAIFDNFRRKNWRFSQKPIYDQNFSEFSFVLSQNRQFFR